MIITSAHYCAFYPQDAMQDTCCLEVRLLWSGILYRNSLAYRQHSFTTRQP